MKCYDPSSQIFVLKDKVISIDHSRREDHTVEIQAKFDKNGQIKVESVKQLK